MNYPTKSPAARAICLPRWEGKGNSPKVDPCGGCPLFQPCVNEGRVTGLESFTRWITGINTLAESLTTTEP